MVVVVLGSVLVLAAAAVALGTFFLVQQQTVAVVQRFGRFRFFQGPGLGVKIPLVDQIAGYVSLRIQPLELDVETKTLDNVFVRLPVVVQYRVIGEKVYEAFYKLTDPSGQMTALVMDVVRGEVPKMSLDAAFEQKDHIAEAIKRNLAPKMDDYGYEILSVQVLDVEPDQRVKDAMNQINAAQRLQVAAQAEAEAAKIKQVKAAEAEAESKKLQGKGIADQRQAIIEGLRTSVKEFQQAIEGSRPEDVMKLVMLTQYLDTLKEMGAGARVILLPHAPGGMTDLESQIRNAIISSDEAGRRDA